MTDDKPAVPAPGLTPAEQAQNRPRYLERVWYKRELYHTSPLAFVTVVEGWIRENPPKPESALERGGDGVLRRFEDVPDRQAVIDAPPDTQGGMEFVPSPDGLLSHTVSLGLTYTVTHVESERPPGSWPYVAFEFKATAIAGAAIEVVGLLHSRGFVFHRYFRWLIDEIERRPWVTSEGEGGPFPFTGATRPAEPPRSLVTDGAAQPTNAQAGHGLADMPEDLPKGLRNAQNTIIREHEWRNLRAAYEAYWVRERLAVTAERITVSPTTLKRLRRTLRLHNWIPAGRRKQASNLTS